MSPTSYMGRHAELYNVFYGDKPYDQEATAVLELLAEAGVEPPARLLDVACGTGSHALQFDHLGFEVTAVDHSPSMLEIARSRAARAGRSIAFHQQDMRSMDLEGATFHAVVCLFDSIGYARTNAGIASTLEGFQRHLEPGGGLVLEYWHAATMLSQYEPVRVRSWQLGDVEILRISETCLVPAEQTAEVTYRILELHPDGTYASTLETQTNRYFLVPDMEDRLEQVGFDVVLSQNGFAGGKVSDDTWHVVTVARRP